MSDENETNGKAGREVSTIQFPYVDLEDGMKVVRQMHQMGGGIPMERDQVAAAINAAGGTLAVKMSGARQFGLIDNLQGKWSITPLGFETLDQATERQARATAFLKVELYRRVYDECRNKPLPGRAGMENMLVQLGVAHKQREKARQTLERSARQAGFFPDGNENRLVAPILSVSSRPSSSEPQVVPLDTEERLPQPVLDPTTPKGGAQGPQFLAWLLAQLPEPGDPFSTSAQANWLRAVAQMFKVAYPPDQEGEVEVRHHPVWPPQGE